MSNTPFGLPESAVDRFLREEHQRSDLYRLAAGNSGILDTVRAATEQDRLLRTLDIEKPYRSILDTMQRDRAEREAFKSLATNAWALSVTETARTIGERHSGLAELQRHLASSVLDTVQTFSAHRSIVDTVIAAASTGERYRQMMAEALPRFTAASVIAERMLVVDTITLRASEGDAETKTAFAARTVIEAQQVAEAIVAATTDEESARLNDSLIDLILGLFANLGPNTIPQLQRMGLVEFIMDICTVLSLMVGLYTLIPAEPAQSPQDKAAFVQINEKVDRLTEETRRYREAEAQHDEAYLADYQRAELSRDATFRRTPSAQGEVVLKAPRGAEVAIAQTQGDWHLVIYRDPLSQQLARAWVFETAVTPLASPLADDDE